MRRRDLEAEGLELGFWGGRGGGRAATRCGSVRARGPDGGRISRSREGGPVAGGGRLAGWPRSTSVVGVVRQVGSGSSAGAAVDRWWWWRLVRGAKVRCPVTKHKQPHREMQPCRCRNFLAESLASKRCVLKKNVYETHAMEQLSIKVAASKTTEVT